MPVAPEGRYVCRNVITINLPRRNGMHMDTGMPVPGAIGDGHPAGAAFL